MPFDVLCEGTVVQILEYLSPKELLSSGLVSKSWFVLTSSDRLWETHLRLLRLGSSHLRHNYCIRLADTAKSKKNAYWIDINESYRPFLTMDDVSGVDSWNFRFKAAAGEMWQNICPWQRGFHAARVAFRPVGVKHGLLERLPSIDGQQLMGLDDVVLLEWSLAWQTGTDPGSLINRSSNLDGQAGTASSSRMHATSSSSSSRLQRQSLAALRRHLRSLDKAAAAPVVIALSQSSHSNLIGDDRPLDVAASARLAQTDNDNIVSQANSSSSSSSSSNASVNVGSPSSSSTSPRSSLYNTPLMAAAVALQHQQQPQQSTPPPLLRRSTRNAVSLGRQTRARVNAEEYDEATRQRLLALYCRAGNCLRFRVNHIAVPTYLLTTLRDPRYRGGFLLESCWAVYASFDLPPKGQCEELEDASDYDADDTVTATATSSSSSRGQGQSLLRITTAEQWREVDQYNAMVVLDDEDEDDEDEDDYDGDDVEEDDMN